MSYSHTESYDLPEIKLELSDESQDKLVEQVEYDNDFPEMPAISPVFSDDDVALIKIQSVKTEIEEDITNAKREHNESQGSDILHNEFSIEKSESEVGEFIITDKRNFANNADKVTSTTSKNRTKKTTGKRIFNEDFATEIILSLEDQISELKERAKTLNFLNCPFKCDSCYKGFVDETAYQNHLTKHSLACGPYACPVCQMRYDTARRLKAHAVTSHSRRYVCNVCPHRSHTVNQAREHHLWHNGHVYTCNLCSMKFRKPTSHLTHMRKRHPTEFVCTACGDSFVGEHGLLMHRSKTHRITARVPDGAATVGGLADGFCSECGLQFDSAEACRKHTITSARHALTHHIGIICRVCGEKFSGTSELQDHLKVHAKRKNTLPKDELTHVHCEECDAKFLNRSKLLAHIRRVHRGLKYNKNIVCELCGKSCTSNATLKYHQRTHTGERPFPCGECSKRFPSTNQLRIHRRTHTDERPYRCTICSKCFRQKPALNRHMRIHTGVKPYECAHCGKCFTQSNSLKTHISTVHLKLPPAYRSKNKLHPAVQSEEKNLKS